MIKMIKNHKNFLFLFLWVILLIYIGSIIGKFSQSNITSWYQNITKSPLTPPNYIFGVTWSILYTMIGIAGWHIWCINNKKIINIKILFICQLVLNWSWTPIFFNLQQTGIALLFLFFIIILNLLIIIRYLKINKLISLILVPYLIWLIFAYYLNFYIWIYN